MTPLLCFCLLCLLCMILFLVPAASFLRVLKVPVWGPSQRCRWVIRRVYAGTKRLVDGYDSAHFQALPRPGYEAAASASVVDDQDGGGGHDLGVAGVGAGDGAGNTEDIVNINRFHDSLAHANESHWTERAKLREDYYHRRSGALP